jgi:glycosyltransferase involved in cell wall biosynthesis
MQSCRQDLQLMPNPLDLKQYAFRLREAPKPNLVWLRAFHSIYNPSLAPRVIAELVKDFPNLRLTMIGPDKGDGSRQETQRVAEEKGVANHIAFVAGVPKSEVPERLSHADIFLNTTNVDNTPVSVLEAMACGLCVVNTNVGGIPYLLRNEHDALLVSPNNELEMAAAIRRVLCEPGLAARLSWNARREVEKFDWSAIFPSWQKIFLGLLRS